VIRISIRYQRPWTALLDATGLPKRSAYIEIADDKVRVRMSWAFRADFARANVARVAAHPRSVVSIGVHGWRGRWLVNGAHGPIAVVTLREPVRAHMSGVRVKLRELLVSVDDPDQLAAALTG
jgi:hypothetical protein